ncbi:MAG: DUF1653 domain-containing protein [Polyangia bacterium]
MNPDQDRPVPPLPPLPTGIYRHYKGGRYEVYGVARHSETLEPVVVYRPLYGEGALWVRPFAMFTGQVELGGERRPRFALESAHKTALGSEDEQ